VRTDACLNDAITSNGRTSRDLSLQGWRVTLLSEFYYGTVSSVTPGAAITPASPARTDADVILDAGRQPGTIYRCMTVSAALSIKDATAIAAICSYSHSAPVPHTAIRVYRVQLVPLHIGPIAVVGELQNRLAMGRGADLRPIIREYWEPTGTWYLQEVLAPSLNIMAEVPAATEAEVYKLRWVQYNQDCERAQFL